MDFRLALVGLVLVVGACSDSSGVTTSTTSVSVTGDTSAVTTGATAATTPTVVTSMSTTTLQPTTTAAPVPPVPLDEIRVDVELIADGFVQPILTTARAGDPRLFVADQPGIVYAVSLDDGSRTVVLDISDRVRFSGEQGLLGLAFDRDDPDRMIVHFSALDGATTVVEYRLDSAGVAGTGNGKTILSLPQPATNHNGGMIDFGPDGFFFLALGDGGGSDDQFNNGQDPFSLLGTILRLDLDAGDPYGIPVTNPFADGSGGAPEIWAFGLRNPWRFSFDGSDLWVGDVGQAAWEEVDLLNARVGGQNGGWPDVEGTHCFRVDPCDKDAFVVPVAEYAHQLGRCSITGGVVYRGTAIPELVGTYLYGDYCSGEVWGLRVPPFADSALLTDHDDVFLPRLPGLASFGVGPDGEVYLLQAGLVWRLVSAG
ncbi:MAG: PQQ-dependent sugar dehydrogenase [Acidimicrobiia bacterium]